jgi:hypothetical protein
MQLIAILDTYPEKVDVRHSGDYDARCSAVRVRRDRENLRTYQIPEN